ncbi:MAG TPA: hypothetical protein VGQ47_01490 [Candidatus Limnocylindrales bacterium]|jgi:hypothetical protein|nr:hypothetical protein [Candidatus Limnocylindrales bacterium]
MRSIRRPSRGRAGALALAALALVGLATAAPVAAGGWASATLDGTPPSPNAGQPAEILFTLKQHGITPIDWEQATVVARHSETGETLRVIAEARGGGHYAAIVTFPKAGTWTWTLELRDLLLDAPAFPAITVRPAAAVPSNPGFPSEMTIAALVLAALAAVGASVFVARRRARAGRLVPA